MQTQQTQEKPWDDSMKRLLRGNPRPFLALVLGRDDVEVITDRSEELKSVTRYADALFEIKVGEGDKPFLMHLEFQTYPDASMDKRMLVYSVLAFVQYDLPVFSCVVYLLPGGVRPGSPVLVWLPNGQKMLEFYFTSKELGDLTPEELLAMGQVEFIPLMPLGKGGASRSVVNTMLAKLREAKRQDLLPIGGTFASLAFGKNEVEDQEWLLRKLSEMQDLVYDTPYYQHILQQGLEKGLQQGLEQGLEQGHEQGLEEGREELRQAIRGIVLKRFSKLVRLARKQISVVDDPVALRQLIIEISTASTAEEVQHLLLALDENEPLP